ncbi:hypothetical protein RJ639_014249 [Escallonia herrerae]|uniref:Uncharacterized protein n=1 Tax=Escallonia herrerae TaxID=1293975 RepID=A0AA88VH22_9ASTE|nr:hypothetical protein RJ639_014249 [Escallonia herrerae]
MGAKESRKGNHEQNLYYINLGVNNNKQRENEWSPINKELKTARRGVVTKFKIHISAKLCI